MERVTENVIHPPVKTGGILTDKIINTLRELSWASCNVIFPYKNPRPFTKYLKGEYCKNHDTLTGCEIGVSHGINAFVMLRNLPIEKIYLVDPYMPYTFHGNAIFDKGKEIAKKRLKRFRNKTVFIYKTSDGAADDVPDNLDFVYIDGNHEEDYVWRDILNYWKKIKENGVLGGHDYTGNCRGVVRAVDKFEKEQCVELQTKSSDWWMVKTHA